MPTIYRTVLLKPLGILRLSQTCLEKMSIRSDFYWFSALFPCFNFAEELSQAAAKIDQWADNQDFQQANRQKNQDWRQVDAGKGG